MTRITNPADLAALREGGKILAQTLQATAAAVVAGVTTKELDTIAEDSILKRGGKPAFKGYQGFPATLCTSVNDQVVHGIPGNRVLKEGDIIGLDCGVFYKGFFTDAAITVPVGRVKKQARELIAVTEASFAVAMKSIHAGATTGDIGAAVQTYVEAHGFGVVRALVGHGVGKAVHEEPKVPNYGAAGSGAQLTEGLVIAVEPMVTAGHFDVKTAPDHWTVETMDGSLASHYEHTVVVTKAGVEIITQL